MSLIVFGINHQTAPLEVRERFAFSKEKILASLPDFGFSEVLCLSTCNRTEVVSYLPESDMFIQKISEIFQVDAKTLRAHWYVHHERAAMAHLVRVASGLDSMVLGEPQIFGQLKEAYAIAQEAGTLGKNLHQIFQQVFSISKKIRSETAIGKSSVSVAFTAISLSKHIFADLSRTEVLILGAGETASLAARHFAEHGVKKFYFVSRTLDHALALAHAYEGEGFSLDELPSVLPKANIVLAATDSQKPLVYPKDLISASRASPLLLIDLSVPRNIDAGVADLPDCYLYTIDDLQAIVREGLAQRQDAALIANEMIQQEVTHFFREQESLISGEALGAFAKETDQLIEEALQEISLSANVSDAAALAKKLAKRLQHEALIWVKKEK